MGCLGFFCCFYWQLTTDNLQLFLSVHLTHSAHRADTPAPQGAEFSLAPVRKLGVNKIKKEPILTAVGSRVAPGSGAERS